MNRRTFLATVSTLAMVEAAPGLAAGGNAKGRSTSSRPPRKVIVGTAMQSFWGQYPGLDKRLDQLAGIVDQMAAQAKQRYGRGLDLAVLPETAITGEAEGDAVARSVPLEGQVQEVFTRKAREHGCYIVVPTYLLDSKEKKLCSNAAILVGRKGEVLGTYRKVHLVVSLDHGRMEGGATPGDALPVFDCDFGKLGIQICYDMEFDDGWTKLARQGAELIVWPTQSPQTSQPAFRAKEPLAEEILQSPTLSTAGSAVQTDPLSTPGSGEDKIQTDPLPTAGKTGRNSLCIVHAEFILKKVEEGLTAQRIYQDLRLENAFAGSYQSVKRYVHKVRQSDPKLVQRIEVQPAEEVQVDFGTGPTLSRAEGKKSKTWIFRVVLSHSRKAYSEAVLRQNTETFLRCLENTFRHFGGGTLTINLDNLKAAVLKAD